MLGMGRASQYAGWWATGGPISVDMPVQTELGTVVYQEPAYSFLQNNTSRNWQINPSGSYNLTGYSSLSGFNNRRYTVVNTVYLPWPSGLSDNYYGSALAMSLKQTGQSNRSFDGGFNISSGALVITYGYSNSVPLLTLPGAYTNYTNRWLTIVNCGAETSSVYTNWSTVSTAGDNYIRLAVYDTETGELLGKTDVRDTAGRMNISAYSTSVSADPSNADSISVNGFGGGDQQYRQSNFWFSLGTMFDPETETADSWRTTRIPETIGTAKAWISQSFTTYATDGSFYYANSAAGIYSVTNNYNLRFSTTADFSTGYSDTIIPKDRS